MQTTLFLESISPRPPYFPKTPHSSQLTPTSKISQPCHTQLLKHTLLHSEQSPHYSVPGLKMLVTRSCLTLCDPMDDSPLGSSVHGVLQGRILEWLAIPFSRGSS